MDCINILTETYQISLLNFSMSAPTTYTPADIRKMVDEFDDIVRGASIRGDISQVFAAERPALVSIRLNVKNFNI